MKCLHNGFFEVRLVIKAEDAMFAKKQAARRINTGPDDYIQGLLDSAFLNDVLRAEEWDQVLDRASRGEDTEGYIPF